MVYSEVDSNPTRYESKGEYVSNKVNIRKNCYLEFGLTDPDITVLNESSGSALILDNQGKAHSLVLQRDWAAIKRRIELEDNTLTVSRSLSYGDPESTTDSETVSIEDAGLENTSEESPM